MRHNRVNVALFNRAVRRSLPILFLAAALHAQSIPFDSLQQAGVKPGDICIVCNEPLDGGDLVFVYKGRRVPVKRTMAEEFLSNPDSYFNALEARGALFSESAMPEESTSGGWFIFGVWVALSLVFAGLTAHQAVRRGRPAVQWFFTGLVLNFIGFMIILTKKPASDVSLPPHLAKVRETADPVKCPNCGRENHPAADTCSACGTELEPATGSDVSRLHPRTSDEEGHTRL